MLKMGRQPFNFFNGNVADGNLLPINKGCHQHTDIYIYTYIYKYIYTYIQKNSAPMPEFLTYGRKKPKSMARK